MIIHGKNVEFETVKRNVSLVKLNNEGIRLLRNRLRRTVNPHLKSFFQSYLNNDEGGFYDAARIIVEQKFVDVLKKNPEFIGYDNFKIQILYDTNNYVRTFMQYFGYQPNKNRVTIYINLNSLLRAIVFYSLEKVEESIYHEFKHHLYRETEHIKEYIVDRMYNYATKKIERFQRTNYPSEYSRIFDLFDDIQSEGIIEFETKFNFKRRITFNIKHLENLHIALDKLSSYFKVNSTKIIIKELRETKGLYLGGPMLFAMIVLHELFIYHRDFLVYMEPKRSYWFSKRNNVVTIEKIRDLYKGKEFELIFIKDRELDLIVSRVLARLRTMNQNQFLNEYEKACDFFQIPQEVRYFHSTSYNYYATLLLYNYKRIVLHTNDPKIKRQVERFKR